MVQARAGWTWIAAETCHHGDGDLGLDVIHRGLSLSSITVTAHEFKGKKQKTSKYSMAELHTGLKQALYQGPPREAGKDLLSAAPLIKGKLQETGNTRRQSRGPEMRQASAQEERAGDTGGWAQFSSAPLHVD